MLQPAASSAQSILALTLGGQPAAAENPGAAEGFAALLAGGLAIDGEAATAAPVLPAATLAEAAAAIRQAGKATGNPTGNILPVLLPDGKVLPAQFESDNAKPVETPVETASAGQTVLDPTLTALILAQTTPIVTTAPQQAITAEASQPASTKPQAATQPEQPITNVAAPVKNTEGTAQPRAIIPTALTAAAPAVIAEPANVTANQPQGKPQAATAAPAMTPQVAQFTRPLTIDVPAVKAATDFRAIPAPVVQPEDAATVAVVQPAKASPATPTETVKAAIQVSLTLPVVEAATQPAKIEAGKAAKAEPAVRSDATVTAPPTATAPQTVTAPQAAIVAPRIEMPVAVPPQPVAETVAARAATTATPASSADSRSNPAPEATPARVAAATPELTAVDPAKPIAAAELQPILAFRDAQPVTSASNAPVTTPTTTAQPQGHDFATLVDRLVEARDAAMPQAVKAAIHHADFGKVSLDFLTDDNRLTVSMASADPGFAPAVQAAAAMQANTSTDSGTNSQRQDQRQDGASQQQQANASASNNGQPQAQAQSQGSARGGERERGDPGRPANGQATDTDSTQAQNDAQGGRRGSIYA